MKQNNKTKLVAFVALVCGSALNHCFAQDTAFGTIQTAMPAKQPAERDLPPIVAADSMAWQKGEIVGSLPPIVTPDTLVRQSLKSSDSLPPIVLASEDSAKISAKPTKSSMLAPIPNGPIKPIGLPKPAAVVEIAKTKVTALAKLEPVILPPAPAVVQATMAPSSTEQDSSVQQAAQWGVRSGMEGSGKSSAGVQIYPDRVAALPTSPAIVKVEPARTSLPPIITSDSEFVSPSDILIPPSAVKVGPTPDPVSLPPITAQEYSTPTVLPPITSPSITLPSARSAVTTTPISVPIVTTPSPAPVVQQPMMAPAPMLPQATLPTLGNGLLVDPPIMDSPVIMDSMSDAGIVSGCQSCGPGGCYNSSGLSSQFNSCGSVSHARRYLIAEALYFDRDDGVISNTNFGALSDFDWDWGARLTIGNRTDAIFGQEFSYMGILPLEEQRTRTNPVFGQLNARFVPAGGLTTGLLNAFFNADSQVERKETKLHSIEFNRVRWGWDVVKAFVGIRYIHVDDEYSMTSTIGPAAAPTSQGLFTMDAVNNLIGPHIGGELFYDVGYRLSSSFAWKAGGYVNFNRFRSTLDNNGVRFLDNRDNNVSIAGSLEASYHGHVQLSQNARLRFGYNVLWLGDVASVSDNYTTNLTPLFGSNAGDDDDMFFHGFSFGFEAYR